MTDAEVGSLVEFAKSYSLTRFQVQAAHQAFLLALAQKAVEDGKVTRDERRELAAVAEALGLGTEAPKYVVVEARAALADRVGATCQPLPETWQLGDPLRVGDGVAFTGCDDLERARLEGCAQAAGLRVTGAVSRKTAVLVTDGVDDTTSKARKAEELGTRIVSPEAFAVMVQYVQPADA
ncbi:MAG TPA: BRCT domain-containing protein [Polyangiaceae bacterium]|nr:BRCT domain-containing protein [Polyangiaceae bacterium]